MLNPFYSIITLAASLIAWEYHLQSTTEIFVEILLEVLTQLCTATGTVLPPYVAVEIVSSVPAGLVVEWRLAVHQMHCCVPWIEHY